MTLVSELLFAVGAACGKVVNITGKQLLGRQIARDAGRRKKGHRKEEAIGDRLQDAAATAAIATAEAIAKRPGVQASLDSLSMKIATGNGELHPVPDEVFRQADALIAFLDRKKTQVTRLAVDGAPGSGKSTLAKVLAERLGFTWRNLDYVDMDCPQDFSEERMIYEHHRLLRTQDIDCFDIIIYIDEPVSVSKEKCLGRKRGGVNVEIFNYDKLKTIGWEAFKAASGEVYEIPDSYIKVKIRPLEGFGVMEKIRAAAGTTGLATGGFSKEELLFLSVYGKPAKGLMAYVTLDALKADLSTGLTAGIEKFLAS